MGGCGQLGETFPGFAFWRSLPHLLSPPYYFVSRIVSTNIWDDSFVLGTVSRKTSHQRSYTTSQKRIGGGDGDWMAAIKTIKCSSKSYRDEGGMRHLVY